MGPFKNNAIEDDVDTLKEYEKLELNSCHHNKDSGYSNNDKSSHNER